MARDASRVYGEPVVMRALRSFLAEPPAPHPPPPLGRDWALVAAVLSAGALEVALRDDVVWPVLALVAVLPALCLPWRRTRPLLVTAAAFGAIAAADVVALVGAGEPIFLLTLGYVLLLPYSLFRWGSGVAAAAGLAGVVVVHAGLATFSESLSDVAVGVAFLSLPAALGAAARYRAGSRLSAADQIRLREREQLARELHDTVAHHVSAIAIRAQAGRALAPSQPDAAVDALEVIEEAASRTLADMRALVGTLRDGREADFAPQRGVTDIELLAQNNENGPSVEVQFSGKLDALPPLVDAALYRIAQESITNALRHARQATRVDVRVTGHEDRVHMIVQDDGAVVGPTSSDSGGYGLAGMRERAALLGGTLQAGPAERTGWTITAVLPRERQSV
jgi:signal transduction histidine kinase